MKLTLRQKNYRPFTVMFTKNHQHVFEIPQDRDLARERLWSILDETGPTQAPQLFYSCMHDALSVLARCHQEHRRTSFYCGSVCLTLE